jgi:hypothetical protein
MLVNFRNLRPHLIWIFLSLVVGAACCGWYYDASMRQGTWLGGSSGPGFVCGLVGGGICFFEMLLWWRKKKRVWRIGRAQTWMRAHIWFGLVCVPILVFHSGLRLGGWLSAVLLILVFVIVASGIYGLFLQQFLPSRLLRDIQSETIYSQIAYVRGQLVAESERLVLLTCGPEDEGDARAVEEEEAVEVAGTGHLATIGAVRHAGMVSGKVIQTRTLTASVPGSEPLRVFHKEILAPYLTDLKDTTSPLNDAKQAAKQFTLLRSQLDPAAHETVNALETMCTQRRQFATQRRYHFLLHSWLWVHLPLSWAMIILMFLHIFVAMKYW